MELSLDARFPVVTPVMQPTAALRVEVRQREHCARFGTLSVWHCRMLSRRADAAKLLTAQFTVEMESIFDREREVGLCPDSID
jgi:hypothetical protein